jgi:hypothetical protein
MHRSTPLAALAVASLALAASDDGLPSPRSTAAAAPASRPADSCKASGAPASPSCADQTMRRARAKEVPVEKNAPHIAGHPLTAVVVTQCNLLVAVYLTMPDGRLLRYDSTASVPADRLVQMAYTATRSERVEVSCHDRGAAGYERHEPL